jgi:hypothetical protein
VQRLETEGRTQARSTAGVTAAVDTVDGPCERCGGPTHVQKTHGHRVVTLEHGAVWAHETVRVCVAPCQHPSGDRVTRRSAYLSSKVPPGGVYGYDLEVFLGLGRFVHHRQREELRAELAQAHGISLSSGEVSRLTARFVDHLEALHRVRAPALHQALDADGGYPLHIDATGEDGRGTLFATYAGSRQWVLGAWKLATERAELILPCLRQTVALFGAPMAIMRDLGKAVIPAARALVTELELAIPILSCAFHFLKDIGKDLLTEDYHELRDLLRRFRLRPALRTLARDLGRQLRGQLPDLRGHVEQWAATPSEHVLPAGPQGVATVRALAQWALDYAADGRYGFPFDLPYLYFYQRCYTVRRAADAFLRHPPEDAHVRSALHRLARVLDPVVAEVPFARTAGPLAARAALFNELRATLRLRPDAKPSPALLSPEQAAAELRDIHAALDALTQSLRERRPQRGPAQDTREAIDLILDHLDRHGDSLWGHVIPLPATTGGGVRVVDRTNLIQESFWHQLKHGERRRSGRKVLTYDFESLPAAAALACNLARRDYVEILCGSLDQLPQAFAELDQARRRRDLATPPSQRPSAPSTPEATADGDATAQAEVEPLETPDPEADLADLVSASFPRDDRRLNRATHLRERIQTAARSRAPRCVPRRSAYRNIP